MKPKHNKSDYGIHKGILKWIRSYCSYGKAANNWRKMHKKPMRRDIQIKKIYKYK